jgi:hypothetical protein
MVRLDWHVALVRKMKNACRILVENLNGKGHLEELLIGARAVFGFDPGSGQVGFVVDKVTLGRVFSEYFGFPCQSSFYQILHHYKQLPGAGTIGQSVAAVPSGPSWTTPPTSEKKKELGINLLQIRVDCSKVNRNTGTTKTLLSLHINKYSTYRRTFRMSFTSIRSKALLYTTIALF